jgi:hypothetical protein
MRKAYEEHTHGSGISLDTHTNSIDEEGDKAVGLACVARATLKKTARRTGSGGGGSRSSGNARQGIRHRSAGVTQLKIQLRGGDDHVLGRGGASIGGGREGDELIHDTSKASRNLNASDEHALREKKVKTYRNTAVALLSTIITLLVAYGHNTGKPTKRRAREAPGAALAPHLLADGTTHDPSKVGPSRLTRRWRWWRRRRWCGSSVYAAISIKNARAARCYSPLIIADVAAEQEVNGEHMRDAWGLPVVVVVAAAAADKIAVNHLRSAWVKPPD